MSNHSLTESGRIWTVVARAPEGGGEWIVITEESRLDYMAAYAEMARLVERRDKYCPGVRLDYAVVQA